MLEGLTPSPALPPSFPSSRRTMPGQERSGARDGRFHVEIPERGSWPVSDARSDGKLGAAALCPAGPSGRAGEIRPGQSGRHTVTAPACPPTCPPGAGPFRRPALPPTSPSADPPSKRLGAWPIRRPGPLPPCQLNP
jgi:hypothetical protein